MRIFLLAISFPPCSYSSTTCLAFALHDGSWAVVRLADMVHNSSLTGQWAICYFIPFADICHIIFYFPGNCHPFFELFFDFFEIFSILSLFRRSLKKSAPTCLFRPFVSPVFCAPYIHSSGRFFLVLNVHSSVRFFSGLKDTFTNFRHSSLCIFVYFA